MHHILEIDRVCDVVNQGYDTEGGWAGAGLCLILFLFTLYAAIVYIVRDDKPLLSFSVTKVFYLFLVLFIIARGVLCLLSAYHREHTEIIRFVLHRLCPALFATTFTVLLFYWIELFHQNFLKHRSSTDALSSKVFWAFAYLNLFVYIKVLVLSLIIINDRVDKTTVLEVDMVFMGALDLLLSVGFLFYGISLYSRASKAHTMHTVEERNELVRILLITAVLTVSFLVRVFMELWLAGTLRGRFGLPPQPNDMWFDVVLWRFPELLPAFAETLVMYTIKSKNVRDNKFIEDLYRESEESIVEDDVGLIPPRQRLNIQHE